MQSRLKKQTTLSKRGQWKESRNRAGRSSSSRRSMKETDEVGSENPLGRWVGCRPGRVVENSCWCQEKNELSARPREGGRERAQGRLRRNRRRPVRADDYSSCPKPVLLTSCWQDEGLDGAESGRRGEEGVLGRA